jgi:hypothetical protein
MEMHVLPRRDVFEIAARNRREPIETAPDNMAASLDFISTTFLLRKRLGQYGRGQFYSSYHSGLMISLIM